MPQVRAAVMPVRVWLPCALVLRPGYPQPSGAEAPGCTWAAMHAVLCGRFASPSCTVVPSGNVHDQQLMH